LLRIGARPDFGDDPAVIVCRGEEYLLRQPPAIVRRSPGPTAAPAIAATGTRHRPAAGTAPRDTVVRGEAAGNFVRGLLNPQVPERMLVANNRRGKHPFARTHPLDCRVRDDRSLSSRSLGDGNLSRPSPSALPLLGRPKHPVAKSFAGMSRCSVPMVCTVRLGREATNTGGSSAPVVDGMLTLHSGRRS
jgi:hypothetical protein